MNFVELLTCSLDQTLVLYLDTITDPLAMLSVCTVVLTHAFMKFGTSIKYLA